LAQVDKVIRVDKATVAIPGSGSAAAEGLDQFIETCRSHWSAEPGRLQVVTRAPGRLDFMGGMADFSGALALQMPIGGGARLSRSAGATTSD